MDVYIYEKKTRKVKGEDEEILVLLAELTDFENEEAALEALADDAPDLLGVPFVIFTEAPREVTLGPPPESKYSFNWGNGAVSEGDDNEDDGEDEVEEEKPAAKRRAAKKPPARRGRSTAAAKTTGGTTRNRSGSRKPPAGKSGAKTSGKTTTGRSRSAPKAGTRSGSKARGRRTPFTANPGSAD